MGRACPSEFFSSLGKKSPTNRREIFPNCHGQENFSQQSLVLDSTGNLPPAVMDSAGNFFLSSQGQYRKSFPSSLGQYRKSFPSSHGQYRKSFPSMQSRTVQENFSHAFLAVLENFLSSPNITKFVSVQALSSRI